MDWTRMQPRDEKLTAQLHELLESYPTGHDKLDKGNWHRVDQVMRSVHDDLGMDKRIPLDDEGVDDERTRQHLSNRRWVRALTSLFRAHSFRFRTGSGDLALPLFADALKHLRAESASAQAWTTFELAELKLELGDPAAAAEGLHEAARLL